MIEYKDYFDKVTGCFLGKCIGGTIGTPYEGLKQDINIEFDEIILKNMLPNDDLDLQILWFEVVEEKGLAFTSDDLAKTFLNNCPYSPGEYAIFKKNYRKGIHPPNSGSFNNSFYINGMGCSIRSEVWGCLAPNNPNLAANLALRDGVLDHSGDSVYAEQFFAALESMAFEEGNLEKLISSALDYIPENTKIKMVINDTVKWCNQTKSKEIIKQNILRNYGHPDCTNLYQNIGFTIASLILGELDIIKTSLIAVSFGFDTDCSAATAAAIVGLIRGGQKILKSLNINDCEYISGVNSKRKKGSVISLCEDICRLGAYFAKQAGINILNSPDNTFNFQENRVNFIVKYNGKPVTAPGMNTALGIEIYGIDKDALVKLICPIGFKGEITKRECDGEKITVLISITQLKKAEYSSLENIFTITATDGNCKKNFDFGLSGAAVWRVYGPFWENYFEIPEIKKGKSYYDYIKADAKAQRDDLVRDVHINVKTEFDKQYLSCKELSFGREINLPYSVVQLPEDRFYTSELCGFAGPSVLYMHSQIISDKEIETNLLIGRGDSVEVWLNGEKLVTAKGVCFWTAENLHLKNIRLLKGMNNLVLKINNSAGNTPFSVIFTHSGEIMSFPEHLTALKYKNFD